MAAACDESGEFCSTRVKKGEKAPYTGELLTDSLSIDLGIKAKNCESRLEIERDYRKSLQETEVAFQRRLLEIERETHAQEIKALEKALSESQLSWYEEPAVAVAFGVVLSFGVTLLAVKALDVVAD